MWPKRVPHDCVKRAFLLRCGIHPDTIDEDDEEGPMRELQVRPPELFPVEIRRPNILEVLEGGKMIQLKCKKHPRYTGELPPRASCQSCISLYELRWKYAQLLVFKKQKRMIEETELPLQD